MTLALDAMSLDRLPVPGGLELPRAMLGVVPLVCTVIVVFVARRLVRRRPAPWGAAACLAPIVAGAVLHLTELWWQYSIPVFALLGVATLCAAIEVVVRSDLRPHRSTVAALVALNVGTYLYLAAVLQAYS